jgi:acyl transferase domain-containing protein
MSVILGVTSSQELISYMVGRIQDPFWRKALRDNGIPQDIEEKIVADIKSLYLPWHESAFPGLLGNVVAGRIANRFNLGGTNCVVDAACASSLAALNTAVCELQLHRCDSVIVGGADTLNDPFMHMCFSRTPALSLSGDCRPFAKSADGTLLGEGISLFVLKRLHDAERDQNKIYAVIRGMGSSSDGRSKSIYAPVSTGQAKAIRRCYEFAGYTPDTISFIEGHGTATDAGDIAEFNGLKLVFGDESLGKEEKQWCALGSIKSQIGHTKAAAGAASLFKVAMSLRDKVLAPTIKVDEPNPHFDIESSPFYLNTITRPWLKPTGHPRRASFSSFGFGGTIFMSR